MEDPRHQKELFEFEPPKRPFPKLANMLPKPDFEGKVAITLTLEKIVFISIGMIMFMVIVFAAGVESGKTRAISRGFKPAQKATQPQTAIQDNRGATARPPMQPAASVQQSFFSMAPAVPTSGPAAQKSAATLPRRPGSPDRSKPYTIVAATFSKHETAQAAAAFLQKEGFSASVVYTDPYYRVCVGAYPDMRGARIEKDLLRLKRIYRDAFVRRETQFGPE